MIALALAVPGLIAAAGVWTAVAVPSAHDSMAGRCRTLVADAGLMVAEAFALVGLAVAAEVGATYLVGGDGRRDAALAASFLAAAALIGVVGLVVGRGISGRWRPPPTTDANAAARVALTVLGSVLSLAAVGYAASAHLTQRAAREDTLLLAGALGAAAVFTLALIATRGRLGENGHGRAPRSRGRHCRRRRATAWRRQSVAPHLAVLLATVGLVAIAGAVCATWAAWHLWGCGLASLLEGSPDDPRRWVEGFGLWAPVVFVGIVATQVVVAPIPGGVLPPGRSARVRTLEGAGAHHRRHGSPPRSCSGWCGARGRSS